MHQRTNWMPQVTMRLLAGSDQMGAVLGVKGSIIRQVSMDTGARLAVLDPNAPNAMSVAGPGDSVLEMVGMQPQVCAAWQLGVLWDGGRCWCGMGMA